MSETTNQAILATPNATMNQAVQRVKGLPVTQNAAVKVGAAPPVTSQSVNRRIDKMGQVFNKMDAKVTAMNQLMAGLIAVDEDDATALLRQMDELQAALGIHSDTKCETAIELGKLKQQIDAVEGEMDDVEANLFLNVCGELDGDNKPMWTNKEQREAATCTARRGSDEYQELQDEWNGLGLARMRLQAQLNEATDRDKANRIIYGGMIARLNNITARLRLNDRRE